MSETRSRISDALKVSSGNLLEMYDFMVFGYYAAAVGRAFFPAHSAFASLMLSLMTFGAGYLMRPIGALVLGSYTDRHGRRKGLIITLTLMSVGTLTLALTPGFATIGYLAPVLVLAGRLVQGFSAGVELGSVSVYLSEIGDAGAEGVLRLVAIGQPTGRRDFRRRPWRGAERRPRSRDDERVGLAGTALDRLRDRAGLVRAAPVAAGDRSVRAAQ